MHYAAIVKQAAKEAKLTNKYAKVALDLFLLQLRQELSSVGKSRVSGLGTFKAKLHKAREVQVPGTLEKRFKTSHYSVHFAPDKSFTKRISTSKKKG